MKIAGLGFRRTATPADLRAVLSLVGHVPDQIAVLRRKGQTPTFQQFAADFGRPVILLDDADITGEHTETCSPRIKARFGTGSVAEALALVAARRHTKPETPARLICPRYVSSDGLATVAIAETTT